MQWHRVSAPRLCLRRFMPSNIIHCANLANWQIFTPMDDQEISMAGRTVAHVCEAIVDR